MNLVLLFSSVNIFAMSTLSAVVNGTLLLANRAIDSSRSDVLTGDEVLRI